MLHETDAENMFRDEQTRKHIVCPACTSDPSRPIMLEEGEPWKAHQRTRRHRRALKKKASGRRPIDQSSLDVPALPSSDEDDEERSL